MRTTEKALRTAEFDSRSLDRRLVESSLAFANGTSSRECFGWVADVIASMAKAANANINIKQWDWDFEPDTLRRHRFVMTLEQVHKWRRVAPTLQAKYQAQMDAWLDREVRAFQVVTFWRVDAHSIVETPVPRLDSVDRCLAYAIGLQLLKRHGFDRAVKRCPFVEDPDGPNETESGEINLRRLPHWFLQLPITKQTFCCQKHAAAFRQREKRARDANKKRRRN